MRDEKVEAVRFHVIKMIGGRAHLRRRGKDKGDGRCRGGDGADQLPGSGGGIARDRAE